MTKLATITLSRSRDIPFNKLILSQANVRKTKAGVSIEELSEDIARRTLLQSLSVRAVLDAGGAETGMFEVPAGGRRYRALERLVKQKRLARNALIPCVVRTDGMAEEDSLAENVQRAPLHPLDQFRAFKTMADNGLGEDEIAAAFFTTTAVVRQRLRLAAVAPALLDVYAEEGMTLDQLMAFTVNPDPERQVQVWEAIQKTYNRDGYRIRQMLTERAIRASDRRAQFVLDDYLAADGMIMRDLFNADQGGWLQDPALLERLVIARLQRLADTLSAEGWKWVETAVDFPYGHTTGLRHVPGQPLAVTEAESATIAALVAEQQGYEEKYAQVGEYPDAVDLRLGEIETALEALNARPRTYDPDEIAIAGVFISIDSRGEPRIERGYVRAEDEPVVDIADTDAPQDRDDEATPADDTGAEAEADLAREPLDDNTEEPGRLLPDRLVSDMTTHRTLALREALANQPDLAFLTVLHALCLNVFSRGAFDSCVEIEAKTIQFAQQPDGLANAPCAVAIAARHQAWAEQLPSNPAQMWATLEAFDSDSRQALFAHCAGQTVNALVEPWNKRPRAIAHADTLAQALALDMTAAGWTPTAQAFFGRISKARMLEAVREAKGDRAAESIAHLKKDDMASAAAGLVEGSGWLPAPLRTRPLIEASVPAALQGADDPTADEAEAPSAVKDGETAMEGAGALSDDQSASPEPHAVAAE
jgi:ParB family chromosome partitioning protein